MELVTLGDSLLAFQQSRYFMEITTAVLSGEKQIGVITITVTPHNTWNNQACCVYIDGILRGRVAVDVHDGADHKDYIIKHALEQAGLELTQP